MNMSINTNIHVANNTYCTLAMCQALRWLLLQPRFSDEGARPVQVGRGIIPLKSLVSSGKRLSRR